MSTSMVLEPERTRTWRLIRFLFVASWRFFSGNFMDGKTRNDSTWWRDASSRVPAHKKTWWSQKSRIKRACWRNACFWPTTTFICSLVFFTSSTLIVLLALMPGIVMIAAMRVWRSITIPVIAHDHSGQKHSQVYIVKPKVKRFASRLKFWRPSTKSGVIPPEIIRSIDSEVPPEVVREVLLSEAKKGAQPIVRITKLGG